MEENNEEAYDEMTEAEVGMDEEATDEMEEGSGEIEEAIDEMEETKSGQKALYYFNTEEALEEVSPDDVSGRRDYILSEEDMKEIVQYQSNISGEEGLNETTFEGQLVDEMIELEAAEELLYSMESPVDEIEFVGGWFDSEENVEEEQIHLIESEEIKEVTHHEELSEEEKIDFMVEDMFPEEMFPEAEETMGYKEIYEQMELSEGAEEYLPALDSEIAIEETLPEPEDAVALTEDTASQGPPIKQLGDWRILVVNFLLAVSIITILVYVKRCVKCCPEGSGSTDKASDERVKPLNEKMDNMKALAFGTGYTVKEAFTEFWGKQKVCWRLLKDRLMCLSEQIK